LSTYSYKTVLALGFSLVASSAFTAENDAVSLSVGLGASYGGLVGVTASVPLSHNIEFYGGIGSIGAMGYVAGVNYYISDRVRLTANYGTNAVVDDLSGYKAYQGLNIGVGYVGRSRDGWSMDLYYRDISAAKSRSNELRNQGYTVTEIGGIFGASLGYRW